MRILLAVTVAILSVFGASSAPRASAAAADDAPELKGEWGLISLKMDGKVAPDDLIKGFVSTFEGGSYTNMVGDRLVEQGTYVTDGSKSPKTVDFTIKKGPDAGKTQLGIYQIVGETVTICVAEAGSDKRPEDFTAVPSTVVVLKKLKK
jgi:uncharacterized protein (TIGR03067 family)